MSASYDLYLSIGRQLGAEESQMFGKPCFKVNKKAFICYFDECLVCKLSGDMLREASSMEGSIFFDPSRRNRPMKEWIQLPFRHKDSWHRYAAAAMDGNRNH